METIKESVKFGGKELILEKGELAPHASSAVVASYGETVVLATVVVSEEAKEGVDFFPMLVDYEERLYAAGKISGSRFIKREGRPSDEAILAARLIDRPLRPLFPKDFRNDCQIIVTVLSYDGEQDPDVLAINAASAALLQSKAPFLGPLAACRIGLLGETFILNPTSQQLERSKLDLVVAGKEDRILMLEGSGAEIPEDVFLKAIAFAQKNLKPLIEIQEKFKKEVKQEPLKEKEKVLKRVEKLVGKKLEKVVREMDKEKRDEQIAAFEKEALENLEGTYKQVDIRSAFGQILEKEIRKAILKEELRPDGRKLDEIRPIEIKIGLLPRTHGSALFTRGETQVLSIVTLGAPGEEQIIETMELEAKKRFMHHYNFPPFSTGEVRPLTKVSRREIGHGVLVERALLPLLPKQEDFPYTIRVVSEVLSSNGSTSMASVSASSLALMEAGVPIKKGAAGISIGLIKEKEKYKILTDIQGIEDFAGDMDLKVAGTEEGITACQLDTKTTGLDLSLIKESLKAARKARLEILKKMKAVLAEPKKELSPYAPKIEVLKVHPEKIREIIGPGGKTINRIIAETGVSIDIEPDGRVYLSSTEPEGLKKAVMWILNLTREAKIGEIFQGRVKRICDFGCFVEIWPGQEGLVHISELAPYRVKRVSDIVRIGQIIPVKVLSIDEMGRINLSLKRAK